MEYLCKSNNISCDKLSYYNNNRYECLSILGCEKDKAKKIYLSIINGGYKDFHNLQVKPNFILELRDELINIHNKIVNLNKDDFRQFKKKKHEINKFWNLKACYTASLVYNIQNKILMRMLKFFNNPDDCVLCFDGLMLRKGKNYDIKKCEEYIHKKLNIHIKLKIKPMDDIIDIPSKLKKVYHDPKQLILNLLHNNNDVDISRYLTIQLSNLHFTCVNIKENILYYFDGKWKKDNECIKLRKEIVYLSKDIKSIEVWYIDKLRKDIVSDDENKEYKLKQLEEASKGFKRLYKLFRNRHSLNNIIHEFCSMNYNEHFEEELDINSYLLGFNNGVYDLKIKQFRYAKPEDKVSMSVGYDYNNEKGDFYNEMDTIFIKTFPNEEVREYIKNHIADALCGKRKRHLFTTHCGSGSNGKSMQVHIIDTMLGQYCMKLPKNYFNNEKANASAPDPYKINLRNKRYAYVSEPPRDKKNDQLPLDLGLVKDITGGEKINGRLLFSNRVIEFKPNASINIYCNDKLSFNGDDTGAMRRIRVINYISRFQSMMDNKEITEDNYENNTFKGDDTLEDRIKNNPMDIMHYFLDIYNWQRQYFCPDIIIEESNEYTDDNNDFKIFISEKIEKGGDNDFILLKDIKNKFNMYNQSYKLFEIKTGIQKFLECKFIKEKKINNIKYKNIIIGFKWIFDDTD